MGRATSWCHAPPPTSAPAQRRGRFRTVEPALGPDTGSLGAAVILPWRGAASLHQLPLAPLIPDALAFRLGLLDGILGAQDALGGLGEHDIEDPFLVDLVDGRVGVAGVANVGGPIQHVL